MEKDLQVEQQALVMVEVGEAQGALGRVLEVKAGGKKAPVNRGIMRENMPGLSSKRSWSMMELELLSLPLISPKIRGG